MFKIIIADDEPVIIRGLKKMMNWERLNAEVIGEGCQRRGTSEKDRGAETGYYYFRCCHAQEDRS